MALKEYSTVINGMATTVQLSDEDAKLQGYTKKDLVSDREVEVVEAEREAKAEDPQHTEAKAKTAAANKQAASPQNKAAAEAPKV